MAKALFIGISLLFCCNFTVHGQELSLDAYATLHLSAASLSKTRPVTVEIFHCFPAYDHSKISDSLSDVKKEVYVQVPIRSPQDVSVEIDKDRLQVWLSPNDTLHIDLQHPDSPLASRYSFRGHTAPQYYYLAQKIAFPVPSGQLAMNAGINAENLSVFSARIDSITAQAEAFLKQYQRRHILPEAFVNYEKNAISYQDAQIRLYMIFYQLDYQNKKQPVSADYLKFLDKLVIRNSAALYQRNYLHFLKEYIPFQIHQKTGMKYDHPAYPNVVYSQVKPILGNEIGEYFHLWNLGSELINNPKAVQEDLVKRFTPGKYSYLKQYLQKQVVSKVSKLAVGEKAPAFHLTDLTDSLVSLQQFKGKVVYLCFWFTGCAGCIHEFPAENQLVQAFQGQPVEIISICTQSSLQAWKASIFKYQLQTLHLFANPAWQKTLEEKYGIQVYPHYVLIDPEGKIVENYSSRPSQQAEHKIRQVLQQFGN